MSKSRSKRESKAASREKEFSGEELDLSAAVAFRSGWRDENSVENEVEDEDVEGDVVE